MNTLESHFILELCNSNWKRHCDCEFSHHCHFCCLFCYWKESVQHSH